MQATSKQKRWIGQLTLVNARTIPHYPQTALGINLLLRLLFGNWQLLGGNCNLATW
jgi:hypothetical protein